MHGKKHVGRKISILLILLDAKKCKYSDFLLYTFLYSKLFLQQVCIISMNKTGHKVKLRGNDTSRRDRETEREEQRTSVGGPGPASAEQDRAGAGGGPFWVGNTWVVQDVYKLKRGHGHCCTSGRSLSNSQIQSPTDIPHFTALHKCCVFK